MSLETKLKWMARMAGLVFILAAAAFLSAITAVRIAIQGREVAMPELVGKPMVEAQNALAQRSIGMKVVDRVYSELPVDAVVRQSPSAGARMKVGQRAHVVVSLGQQKVKVPNVVGQSSRAARVELLRGGLQVGEISSASLPGQEADKVVRQNPPAEGGEAVSPNVNLLVALAEREKAFVMVDLNGLTLPEAQARLREAGLTVDKISYVGAGGGDTGKGAVVVGTVPAKGARVTAGTKVELQVAGGTGN